MATDLTKKLLESYDKKQGGTREPDGPEDNALWAYRKAAAVLHCFYPGKLNPASGVDRKYDVRTLLYDDITYMPGRFSQDIFTLKLDKRIETLKKFESRQEMLAATKINAKQDYATLPNPQPEDLRNMQLRDEMPTEAKINASPTNTSLQQMWVSYLETGKLPDIEQLSYASLSDLLQIITWLDGSDKSLPEAAAVKDVLRRKTILRYFEHLVASNFVGRDDELSVLRKHASTITSRSITGTVTDWLGVAPPRPVLSIHGPGGIGKTALSGKLLWDNVQTSSSQKFFFAYLPFDLGTLQIENPYTFLVEAASQLHLQFPGSGKHIESFVNISNRFITNRDLLAKRSTASSSRGSRIKEFDEENELLFREFANLLTFFTSDRAKSGKPGIVVMIFDTFEEVAYRDTGILSAFWKMLEYLVISVNGVRVLISGRSPVASLGINKDILTELSLNELNVPDRERLLDTLGVDNATAKAIAQQIGGNPLSLRLAANLIQSEPKEADGKGIKDLRTRKYLFFQVDEQIIQGQLYRRILNHIHDENVKKLAHPGMVLRLVSPEVIFEVLAPQCDIPLRSLADAQRLFDDLKREQALVQRSGEGYLIYRPEIRNAMIRLLQQDKFSEVKALHKAAIEYYERMDDDASRAEEMYHRLALWEDAPYYLDRRWRPSIASSVVQNLDEYPDSAKAWLASRASINVPREVFLKADILDWERNVTRLVRNALAHNDTSYALKILKERKERSDSSSLFALEAKAYMLLKKYEDALSVIGRGIDTLSLSANRGKLAELFWLQSQANLSLNKTEDADTSLQQGSMAVQNAGNPIPYMHIVCHRMLIRKLYKDQGNYEGSTTALRQNLNGAFARVNEEMESRYEFVLKLAIALLEGEFPQIETRFEWLGKARIERPAEMLTGENLQGMEDYREPWENETNNDLLESIA